MSAGLSIRARVCAALLGFACLPAIAGPLALDESARLVSPDPEFPLNVDAAIDGDFIIAVGSRREPGQDLRERRGYLFRRDGTNWVYVRTLFSDVNDPINPVPVSVAMKDGLAALTHVDASSQTSPRLMVLQRSGGDYVTVPSIGNPAGGDLEIDGGTIIAGTGSCYWEAETFRPNASGTWVKVGGGTGIFAYCDNEFVGGDVALSGNRFILANPYGSDDPPQAHIFTGVQGTPVRQVLLSPDDSQPFSDRVALEGEVAVVSGTQSSGDYVFLNGGNGWGLDTRIRPVDTYTNWVAGFLELQNGRLLRSSLQDDGEVRVFRRASSGQWDDLARLVPSTGRLHNNSADSSGNRVIAQGMDAVYVWDLPSNFSQPERRQDDFQDGNATGWEAQAGSDFTVVSGTDSLVYRQNSLAGNATSLLNTTAWRNQAIQADIKPLQFQAADRWLGLTVRYIDANNYYYVTLRQSNVLQLRRLVNGQFVTLASMPLTVTPGQTYNIRLEAIGAMLRVYVDGNLVLRARDEALAQGRAGLITYRTRADFDNVIVSPNLRAILMSDNFDFDKGQWTTEGVGLWRIESNTYEQSSVADGARAVTGVNTAEDQIVQARAMASAFGAGAGRWFGLMARYQDADNYYYVTVRNDNTVSLRKLVNGSIVVLDTAPLSVTANTWYSLRLEAVGSSLRAHVNGRLLLEANDTTFTQGSFGLAMYKTAARFDDFRAVQP